MNITSQQFETLPTARNFQQLTTMAPSVTLEMGDHDRRFENSPTVGAAPSAPENNYIIDGLSVTDPRYGTSGANLTMNFVQEVQVMTGGYQAEFGRSTGGVFNVITKSAATTSTATCSTTTATGLDAGQHRAPPEQGARHLRESRHQLRLRRFARRADSARQAVVLRRDRSDPQHHAPGRRDRAAATAFGHR